MKSNQVVTAHAAAVSTLSEKCRQLSKTESNVSETRTSSSRVSSQLLDNFWLKMAGLFGHAWVSSYGASPSGIGADTWAQALTGVTPMQIANGLRETLALGAEFPPSAPHFRKLCFGIPSLAAVKRSLHANEYDRFTRLTMSLLDTYVFAHSDQRTADRLLKEAHELACLRIMRGGDYLPEPVAAITEEKQVRVRADAVVARPYVEQLAALLGDPAHESVECP